MSQSYTKSCMYCKHEIVMSDKGAGKWLPYNLDGKLHECKAQPQRGIKKVETQSKPQSKPLSLEEIDARLKRLESIVIGQPKP